MGHVSCTEHLYGTPRWRATGSVKFRFDRYVTSTCTCLVLSDSIRAKLMDLINT